MSYSNGSPPSYKDIAYTSTFSNEATDVLPSYKEATVGQSTKKKLFADFKQTLAKYTRNSIVKKINDTLQNVKKIESKTFKIINPEHSTSNKIKSAYDQFSIKSPLKSIKALREDHKSISKKSDNLKGTYEIFEKTKNAKRNTKLEIDFVSIKEELQTLKTKLNEELKTREKNNERYNNKDQSISHMPVSDLKSEIGKLNTQIRKIDKLELSTKIYNTKIDYKNAKDPKEKSSLLKVLKGLLKTMKEKFGGRRAISTSMKSLKDKVIEKVTTRNIKHAMKDALKTTRYTVSHPQQQARKITNIIKQKASGLHPKQYEEIERMKKDAKSELGLKKLNEMISELPEELEMKHSMNKKDEHNNHEKEGFHGQSKHQGKHGHDRGHHGQSHQHHNDKNKEEQSAKHEILRLIRTSINYKDDDDHKYPKVILNNIRNQIQLGDATGRTKESSLQLKALNLIERQVDKAIRGVGSSMSFSRL